MRRGKTFVAPLVVSSSFLSCPIKPWKCYFEWLNERESGKHELVSVFISSTSWRSAIFFSTPPSSPVCVSRGLHGWSSCPELLLNRQIVSQPASCQASTSFLLLFVFRLKLNPRCNLSLKNQGLTVYIKSQKSVPFSATETSIRVRTWPRCDSPLSSRDLLFLLVVVYPHPSLQSPPLHQRPVV